jgi:poly(3-hydroxybutyrate) depolymerase
MRKLLLALVLLTGNTLFAQQQTYELKHGLASGPCHQYGRTALFSDQLAYDLANGQLPTPAAGDKWKEITAGDDGQFSGKDLTNGYIYITYNSPQAKNAILNITGHQMVYVNGVPHGGDMYRYGWMYLPVPLKKGINEFYIRTTRGWGRQGLRAKLIFPEKPVYVSTADSTLPFIVKGKDNSALNGAVVVVNTTDKVIKGLELQATIQGKTVTTTLPDIAPLSSRKTGFKMDASAASDNNAVGLVLSHQHKAIDHKTISLTTVEAGAHYTNTFISDIDGSVQYYAVSPQLHPDGKAPALFLSVHGAEVQAINQARAYDQKDWGVLVAPTNRRPRGFNWEDWGRLDALEVLNIGTQEFKPDPSRIYLTGHSMGGHGTWYLGATYPGKWAAIAPCSGYPTLMGYGSADGLIPDSPKNSTEAVLLRASNPSNTIQLANNYKAGGVYILHGDSDHVVSVNYARQMKKVLADFHPDVSYYEYPGGEHWYGDTCVDWGPLFSYFKWHTIPVDSSVHVVDFTTANTAISSAYHWVHILQQQQSLAYSRVQLRKQGNTISGTTTNVKTLSFDVAAGSAISIELDGQIIPYTGTGATVYLDHGAQWTVGKAPKETDKGIVRNGTLKEAFNHRMIFVYGTAGTAEENAWSLNKARYDAETWYYRGNGAVDMLADKDFKAAAYPDRGVIIYGNANTNKAYGQLLKDAPVQVSRGKVTVGDKTYTGDDLAAYFMYPRPDSKVAAVAVIGGTGLKGMKAAEPNQYFAGGSGFPDYLVFGAGKEMDVKSTGFYDNQWQIQ